MLKVSGLNAASLQQACNETPDFPPLSGRKSANPAAGGTPTLKREGSVTDVNEDGSSNSSGTQKEPKPGKSGTDSGGSNTPTTDPNHWSKDEKYDAENMLDVNYKKHLTRHANK